MTLGRSGEGQELAAYSVLILQMLLLLLLLLPLLLLPRALLLRALPQSSATHW